MSDYIEHRGICIEFEAEYTPASYDEPSCTDINIIELTPGEDDYDTLEFLADRFSDGAYGMMQACLRLTGKFPPMIEAAICAELTEDIEQAICEEGGAL